MIAIADTMLSYEVDVILIELYINTLCNNSQQQVYCFPNCVLRMIYLVHSSCVQQPTPTPLLPISLANNHLRVLHIHVRTKIRNASLFVVLIHV